MPVYTHRETFKFCLAPPSTAFDPLLLLDCYRSGLNAMTHLKLETLAFSSPGAMYAMVSSMLGTWSRGQDALIPTGTSAGPAFSVSSKGKDSEVGFYKFCSI